MNRPILLLILLISLLPLIISSTVTYHLEERYLFERLKREAIFDNKNDTVVQNMVVKRDLLDCDNTNFCCPEGTIQTECGVCAAPENATNVCGCEGQQYENCECLKCDKSSISSGITICIPLQNNTYMKTHVEAQNVAFIMNTIPGVIIPGHKNENDVMVDCECNVIIKTCPRGTELDDCGLCSTPENMNKACTCPLESAVNRECVECGLSPISSGIMICIPSNSTVPGDPHYIKQHIERRDVLDYFQKVPGVVFPGHYYNDTDGNRIFVDCDCTDTHIGCPSGTSLDDCGVCSTPDNRNKNCTCPIEDAVIGACIECGPSPISSGIMICVPTNSTIPGDPRYIKQHIERSDVQDYLDNVPGVVFPGKLVTYPDGSQMFVDCDCNGTVIGCPSGTSLDDCGLCTTPEDRNKACKCPNTTISNGNITIITNQTQECQECYNSTISSGVVICVPSNSTDPADPLYLKIHLELDRVLQFFTEVPGSSFPGRYVVINGTIYVYLDCDCNATLPTPSTQPPTTEVPTTEAPTTEVPTTEAPTTEAPTTEAPTTEAPTTEAPTTEAPTTEAPTTEAPTTEAPTTEAPTTEAPTTQAPTTEAPTTEAPTTQAPTTEAPTTEAPTTEPPTTEPPTTEAPTTEAPTTQAPTTEAPTTEAPTTEPPTTEAPTTEAPTTEAPTTEAPTTEAPTTEPPTTEAPTTEAPTTEAPTTEAPTTEAPTTEAPTTEAPTTEAPTTEAPTTAVPTTVVPTTLEPTEYPNLCPPYNKTTITVCILASNGYWFGLEVFAVDIPRLYKIVNRTSQMAYPYDYVCLDPTLRPANCSEKAELDCNCDLNVPTVAPSSMPPVINDTILPPDIFVIEVPSYTIPPPVRTINDNLDMVLAIGIPLGMIAVGMMSLALYKGLSS